MSNKLKPSLNFKLIVSMVFSCFILFMNNKDILDTETNVENTNDIGEAEKSSKNGTKSGRVDINVLKSKLQRIENREFKRNIYILLILVLGLASLGIYLSL